MKKLLSLMTALAFAGAVYAQNCGRPTINSFSPNTGFIGSTVTIIGSNFDANNINNNVVYFGATKAQVISATFGKLEVTVPVGASTDRISVTNQCNLTAYSAVPFNGIFCPTPLDQNTYQNNAQILPVTYGAYNMVAVDLDLDGRPEVLSANNGGGLSVAKNNSSPGSISFSHINFGGRGGQSLYSADMDGDGKKDVITTYNIWLNTSSGPGSVSLSGSAVGTQGVSNYQIAAGDFNGDGKIDIVGGVGGWIAVAENRSNGPGNLSFGPRQLIDATPYAKNGVQVGDIDGDGRVDILCNERGSSNALFYRNTTNPGSSTFTFANPLVLNTGGTGPYRSQIADFNKDGKIDYVTVNYDNPNFNTAVFINTSTPGNVSFQAPINLPSPSCNYRVQVGDVDGDGYPDIVSKSLCNNVFSVYQNTTSSASNTTFAPRIDYTSSAQGEVSGIVIGDLDGDYVPDIATSGISSRQIRFHRNTSSQNDVTPPTAICKNITVALDPSGNVSITPADIDNGSSDACGIDTRTISKSSFTCNDIGANQVTLIVTDNAGNADSCTATVNVAPAAIIVTGQTTVCAGGTVNMNANQGDSYQWYKDGVAIAGATAQSYGATTSGAYTVAVTNAGGCSGTSAPTNVVVNNNPTVNVSPANNAYLCNGSVTLSASQSATYQWKLNGVDIPNATLQTYNAQSTGTYTVEVIDLFGCSAVSSPVTVNNQSAPVASAQNFSLNLDVSTGQASLSPSDINNGSIGCDLSYSVSPNQFDCTNEGQNTVTLTVTDNQGLTSTATAVVTVLDPSNYCNTAPVAVAKNITVSVDGTCSASVTAADVNNGSSDADQDPLTLSLDNNGPFAIGTYTVTLTADDGQASSTDQATVTVVDTSRPMASTQNVSIDLDASGNATILTGVTRTTVWDGTFSGDPNGTTSGSLTNWNVVSGSVDVSPFISGSSQSIDLAGNSNGKIESKNSISLSPGDYEVSFVYKNNDGSPSTANSFTVKFGNSLTSGQSSALGSGNVTQTLPFTLTAAETGKLSFEQTGSNDASGTFLADIKIVRVNPPSLLIENGSTDNCSVASISADKVNFTCADRGANTVTMTVTDASGNQQTASAIVTVNDPLYACNVAPVAVAKNITLAADANCSASIQASDLDSASSDANNDPLTFSVDNAGPFGLGTHHVVLTVSDGVFNSTANATVTVVDASKPIVNTQDITVYLDATGNASISTADIDDGSSDNCGSINLSLDINSFGCADVGENWVTLTAVDAAGNSQSAQAKVSVADSTLPTVLANNLTVYLDANGQAGITTADVDNGSSDNCGIDTLFIDRNSFDCTDLGAPVAVTLTAQDAKNGLLSAPSVDQILTGRLNGSQRSVFESGDVDGDGLTDVMVTNTLYRQTSNLNFRAYAMNAGSGQNGGVMGDLDGDGDDEVINGSYVYNWENGNLVQKQALGTRPQFNEGTIADFNGDGFNDYYRATYYGDPDELWLNDGTGNLVLHASYSIGSYQISATANDVDGDGDVDVIIGGYYDIYLGTNDGSGNLSFQSIYSNGNAYIWNLFAEDLDGDGLVDLAVAPVVGGSYWFKGNGTGGFGPKTNLNTVDNSSSLRGADAKDLDNDGDMDLVEVINGVGLVQLLNDGNGVFTRSLLYATPGWLDVHADDLNGDGVLDIMATRWGPGVILTQQAGSPGFNTATATSMVTVLDTVSPVASAKGLTLYLDANGAASISAADVDNGSSDNCSVDQLTISQENFTCANVGPNTITLSVEDQSGNVSTATAIIDVVDTISPQVNTNNISINLDAAGQASISAADIDNLSSDACGISSLSLDKSNFDCSNVGANVVTLTVIDNNGNSASATATVTVNDVTKPVIMTQNVTVSLDASGSASITLADIENGSSDACGISSSSLSKTSFDCSNLGANTVTLSVTDVNGNVGTATATVTVKDNIAPAISGMPSSKTVVPAPNDCTPSVSWTAPSASDNCTVTLTSTHNPGDNFPVGITTVTYTATDQSGNSVSASFDITVDPTPVVITNFTTSQYAGGYNISCNGASDGAIDISVDGGCEPYSYVWTNGAGTAQDAANLSAGTYTVTVTDANGQTDDLSVTLSEPAQLVASASSSGYLSGNGVSGTTLYLGYGPQSIDLSTAVVGGVGPYTYQWTAGPSSATQTVSPQATTTYTVTVTDANGCTSTDQVTVSVLDVRCAPGNSPNSNGKGNKGRGNGRQVTKVLLCHNGNTICVDSSAVASHLANHNRGRKSCYLGPCGSSAKNGTALNSVAALDMHIYPNPTDGIFNVQIHSTSDAEIKIVLSDIQGRVISVREDYVVNGVTEAQFDLSDFANGVYIVKVIGLSEQQVSRLIKD